MDKDGWKPIRASYSSLRLSNPIRDVVDQLKLPAQPTKSLIALSIGDPTVFGNLDNPDNVNDTLISNIKSRRYNGYFHSAGTQEARNAVARKFSKPESPLTLDDVIITSGCSGALDLAIGVLASEGQNILIPAPGFSLYQTLCDHKGIQTRNYRLLPEKSWEIDLDHLESLIDYNTVAIVINNPSNPCGSVFSKEHLLDILNVCDKHHIPIIADEIYGEMVFTGNVFHPIASLSKTVPILAVGGLAKIYISPGWRVGWVLIHNRNDLFREVKVGLIKLSQLILGANTLAQSIIEECLLNTPEKYYEDLFSTLERQALYLVDRLSKIPGLKPIKPGGAMYMMCGITVEDFKDISNDVDFAKQLLTEEMVFILPGKIFKCENFFRLVICPPMEKLSEACDRIELFCRRHHK